MSIETIVFVLLAVILGLVLINCFWIWIFYKSNKKFDALLENGKIKSLKGIFLRQKQKSDELEKTLQSAFLKIEELQKISQKTIQKTSIVRFNPFNEMGGNQSFVIVLLDDENTGFVISSLFIKEGNRVYAKPVKDGKSDFILSKEEQEAINKATKKNG